MRAKPYKAYKSSGVAWLGDVPEHWTRLSLGRFARRFAGGTPDRNNESFWEDGTIPWINSGAVNQSLVTEPSAYITQGAYNASSARWVEKGDLVMALAGQGKTKGMVAQLAIRTTCNQSMAAICPDARADRRFLFWLLSAQYEQIRNMAGGEQRDGLNLEILGEIPCVLPPHAEQRAIAAFIDRETGRIDTLVAKKRELIERLQEKRTALISHAVTRGLDPKAKLKPSGLPWLGDIPAHWDVTPVRYAFYNLDRRRIPLAGEERASMEKNYPYYGASGIIDAVESYIFDETLILVAEDGANLFSRSTPLAFLASGKYWVNNHAHILKPIKGDIRYWTSALQIFDYAPLITGAAQPKLTSDRLGSICLPNPPSEEQKVIADYLERVTTRIDALKRKAEEAIERLQEYRTALITAAVTGKIDVRSFNE